MSKNPFFPLFIDAYLADTEHFSTEEHGAYLLLLLSMWRRGGYVPNDDRDLARITRLTLSKWRKISARIEPYLTLEPQGWTQLRLKKELVFIEEKRKVAAKNGETGAAKRWSKSRGKKHNENNESGIANAMANAIASGIADQWQSDNNLTPYKESIYNSSLRSELSSEPSHASEEQSPNVKKSLKQKVDKLATGDEIIRLPTNRYETAGEEFIIFQGHVDEFSRLYPSVDILASLRNMRGWTLANPSRRKTAKGALRFVTEWLRKDQDRAHSPPISAQNNHRSQPEKKIISIFDDLSSGNKISGEVN